MSETKTDVRKIIKEFDKIKETFNNDEMEELVGLLAIYVKNLRPPTENWKRLIEVLK